jgi:pimeloyl-ACP methyl ester carboxylesterase
MWRRMKNLATPIILMSMVLASHCGSAHAQMGITTVKGSLPDGATYVIDVPPNWNGVLFLYSHGYVTPGSPNPAMDAGDMVTRAFMLASGFALAGSSYAHTGWAIQEALVDQIGVLDLFEKMVGHPKRTIAWGHSLGGMITAGLVQRNPHRFDAAMPMCGVLSGGVATWNTALDAEFAFKTLLAPGAGLELVNIANPVANLALAETVLAEAQATPQGRARLALSAALADVPGWFTPTSPEPGATDFAGQQMNQFLWQQQVDFPFVFAFRAELEARAQGNPSWNTHVNYRKQLERSADRDEVLALYAQAGLDLDADLDALQHAVRITADENAVHYLESNIIFDGQIHIPVLTMHTTGDGLVVSENEQAYREVVGDLGNSELLRQTFVSRAGHCAFTPAETVAAVETLLARMKTGEWNDVDAQDLNNAAIALGPGLNIFATSKGIVPVAPEFVEFHPAAYLRPFDALSPGCLFDKECREQFKHHDRD